MNDDKTVPKRYTCGTDGTAIEVGNEEHIDNALERRLDEIERRLDDMYVLYWRITNERKEAIDDAIRYLEHSKARVIDEKVEPHINVLWDMLEEAKRREDMQKNTQKDS